MSVKRDKEEEVVISSKELNKKEDCLRRIEEIEKDISLKSLSGGDTTSHVKALRILRNKAKERGWIK